MKYSVLIIVLMFTITSCTKDDDLDVQPENLAQQYMPLHVGNKWKYRGESSSSNWVTGEISYSKYTKIKEIIKDTIIGNETYYLMKTDIFYDKNESIINPTKKTRPSKTMWPSYHFLRNENNRLLMSNTTFSSDYLIADFSLPINDTIYPGDDDCFYITNIGINETNYLTDSTNKLITFSIFESCYYKITKKYISHLGLYSKYLKESDAGNYSEMTLVGCIIDGTVYGNI